MGLAGAVDRALDRTRDGAGRHCTIARRDVALVGLPEEPEELLAIRNSDKQAENDREQ